MRLSTSRNQAKRIDADQFAGRNKLRSTAAGLAAVVASEEGLVATHREAAQRAFGGIVIDGQIAVGAVASQRRPVQRCTQ